MSMFYALIALSVSGSTLAQIITSGSCPDVQVQENFDISKLNGRWYEQARFYTLFESSSMCNRYDYTAGPNNTFKVVSFSRSTVTGEKQIFDSEMVTPDHEQSAKMLIKIPMSPVEEHDNLWVLGVDYNAWAVFFSCNDDCSMNRQYVWILTRQQYPFQSIMKKAYDVVTNNNLDPTLFEKTKQLGCGLLG